ncbi:MAG: hypothetical protein IKG46_02290 [Solobacterium sp.]|nr:hypothetical protein [Solobacterium sp.]
MDKEVSEKKSRKARVYSSREMRKQNDEMNRDYVIVIPQVSSKGIRGFFYRVMIRLFGFAMRGVIEQQMRFNADTVRTVNQITQFVWDSEAKINRHDVQIKRMIEGNVNKAVIYPEKDVAKVRSAMEANDVRTERMMTRIIRLEQEVRELREQLNKSENSNEEA